MKSAYSVLVLVVAATLAGCGGEEEESFAPPPMKEIPQTKMSNDRVLDQFYRTAGLNEPLPDDPDSLMTNATAQRLISNTRSFQQSAQRAKNPEQAINEASEKLAEKIKEAEAKKLWSYVGPFVEAYQVLRPNDRLYQSYAERAHRQMTRPRVALRGLYHDHTSGMTTASLKVYDPVTRATSTENVRMGEKYKGLKFTRIIGKDEGVELEMESTGMTFQVMKGGDLQ